MTQDLTWCHTANVVPPDTCVSLPYKVGLNHLKIAYKFILNLLNFGLYGNLKSKFFLT